MIRLKKQRKSGPSSARRGVSIASLLGIMVLGLGLTAPIAASDFEPKTVIEVVHIQPFQLEESFRFDWRHEKPQVLSGLLVVFKVNPDLVAPSNGLEPVLYAGNQTVQRLNHGHESGFVIGIIPEQLDLSEVPVWFGTPALPEKIDTQIIGSERTKAERFGIQPQASIATKSRTQSLIVASDLPALLREEAAELVIRFSPQERRLAETWRLPVNNR